MSNTSQSNQISFLGKLASEWRVGTYRKHCIMVKDNKLYALNKILVLPFVSNDFDAELLNGDWIEVSGGVTLDDLAIVLNKTWSSSKIDSELDLKEDKSNKGVANGYVPLNGFTKIASQYLSIVNDLVTGGTTSLASAETVKTLKGQIDTINLLLTSDNINLDTVQEIVDAIESIQLSLDTILVNDLTTGGITKALTAEMGKVLKGLIDTQQIVLNGKENTSNKATTMTGNTASNTLYLTAKAIYDWAVGLFQPILVSGTTLKTVNSNSLLGTGDLTISSGAIVPLNEGNGIGYVIAGRTAANYGNVGLNAMDLSISSIASSSSGATGLRSFAANQDNTASGIASFAEGVANIVSGDAAHGEGANNTVSGAYAHGEGVGNTVSGAYAHGEGAGNYARSTGEHSGGFWGTDYTPTNTRTDRLVNYGNGQSTVSRSDAFTIYKNGAIRIFRATLASITNQQSGMVIFDSNNSNRPTIHNGTAWKGLAYTDQLGFVSQTIAPTSATDVGAEGEIRKDNDYLYVCIATNSWKRTPLTTW